MPKGWQQSTLLASRHPLPAVANPSPTSTSRSWHIDCEEESLEPRRSSRKRRLLGMVHAAEPWFTICWILGACVGFIIVFKYLRPGDADADDPTEVVILCALLLLAFLAWPAFLLWWVLNRYTSLLS